MFTVIWNGNGGVASKWGLLPRHSVNWQIS